MWQNDLGRLFWMKEDGPVYLSQTYVDEVDLSGRIIIRGFLPAAKALFGIRDGAFLEIQYCLTNDPTRYYEGETIMRFSGCEIKRRCIPRPIVDMVTKPDVMTLILEIDCLVEILE